MAARKGIITFGLMEALRQSIELVKKPPAKAETTGRASRGAQPERSARPKGGRRGRVA